MDEKKAVQLLEKYSKDRKSFAKVYSHSRKVQEIALKIAKKVKKSYHNLDINFIKNACLLHDIGRFSCPPGKDSIKHGIKGAKILRKEGFEEYALVAERHIGAGISKQDIKKQKLDLPLKDYTPKTKEEKIITHADNLAFGAREGNFKEVYERYRKEVGKSCADKTRRLKEEIESWIRKK